jgi:hypothetical protein
MRDQSLEIPYVTSYVKCCSFVTQQDRNIWVNELLRGGAMFVAYLCLDFFFYYF